MRVFLGVECSVAEHHCHTRKHPLGFLSALSGCVAGLLDGSEGDVELSLLLWVRDCFDTRIFRMFFKHTAGASDTSKSIHSTRCSTTRYLLTGQVYQVPSESGIPGTRYVNTSHVRPCLLCTLFDMFQILNASGTNYYFYKTVRLEVCFKNWVAQRRLELIATLRATAAAST